MEDKGKLEIEALDPIEQEPEKGMEKEMEKETEPNGSTSEKPAVKHLELAKGKPYWDTKDVIGASRTIESFTSQDELRARPGRIKRLWLHYKRHWKLYTVLAIIGLAIGLPILFLVIFPAIAQDLVNSANLPIISASIMSPTPDSVEYSLVASLNVPAGVTVDLKSMNLSLYTPQNGRKDPYIQVTLPEYHLKGKTTVAITNQTATILDEGQFTEFLSEAVDADNFTISAYGTTAAYLGVLKADITLNKNVELAGLNNLNGFTFTEAAYVFPTAADGTNLQGTVILPNPSIVTFELGNVTLNMKFGDIWVGNGYIDNIVLVPGNNTVPIRAAFDIAAALQNLGPIIASQANALKNGNVEISASGNSTIFNGQHIPYYETVLNNLTVTGQVPIIQILTDSLSQFLGSDAGSLISGVLGNLNITSILGDLSGFLGNGNSTTGSGSSNSTSSLLTGLLGGLLGGTSSSSSSSGKRSVNLLTQVLGGLSDPAAKSKRSPSPLLSALGAASGIDSNLLGLIGGLGAQGSGSNAKRTANMVSGLVGVSRVKSRLADLEKKYNFKLV